MLLATILRNLGPHPERCYDSDDDYIPDRVPLLKNYGHPCYAVGADPIYGSKNDSWNVRINDKVRVCIVHLTVLDLHECSPSPSLSFWFIMAIFCQVIYAMSDESFLDLCFSRNFISFNF